MSDDVLMVWYIFGWFLVLVAEFMILGENVLIDFSESFVATRRKEIAKRTGRWDITWPQ